MKTKTARRKDPAGFKRCPHCGYHWPSRNHLLADPHVALIGYQPHFKALETGHFYFNHRCRGTFTVTAGEFTDLYQGPVFEQPAAGSGACPGYCLKRDALQACPALCECAYVREVMQIIRQWRHAGPPDIAVDAAG